MATARLLREFSIIFLFVCAASASALAAGLDIPGSVGTSVANGIRGNVASDFFRPTFDVQHRSGGIIGINLDGTGRSLTILAQPAEIGVWNVATGSQLAQFTVADAAFAATNGAGTVTVVLSRNGSARAYSEDGALLTELTLGGRSIGALFAADGNAVVATSAGIAIFNATQKKFIGPQIVSGGVAAFGPGGKLGDAVIESTTGSIFAVSANGQLTSFSQMSGTASEIVGCSDDATVLSITSGGSETLIAAAQSAAVGQVNGRVFAADRACRLIGGGGEGGTIHLFDKSGGSHFDLSPTLKLGTSDGNITCLLLDSRNARMISGGAGGIVRIWDLTQRRDVLQIYLTTKGWIVVDQNGRFDGSQEGMLDVGWLANAQRVTLDQFSDKYFAPGLLSGYLATSSVTARVASIPDGIFLPPKISLQVATNPSTGQPTMIIALAEDQGGGVGAINLYHNGKLVPPGALLQQQEQTANGRRILAAAFAISPTPGVNTFLATASTTRPAPDGSAFAVIGRSEELGRSYDVGATDSTLYVVSVGINSYRDAQMSLDYAAPDARALATALSTQGGTHFQHVVENSLIDSNASLQNIRSALSGLGRSKPGDVVVLYLAGHGETLNSDWSFVPVDGQFGVPQLTASAIRDFLVAIPAQRVLLMIDSCESGQSADVFTRNRSFEARFLRELGRVSGVAVLAGTRPDQAAAELSTLGHGLFTAAVLAGLSGAADTAPHDGQVTAHELTRFTGTEMRVLLQKLGETSFKQEPAAFALGADFVLH